MIKIPIKHYKRIPIKSYARLPIRQSMAKICVFVPDSYLIVDNEYVIEYLYLAGIAVDRDFLGYIGTTGVNGCFFYDFEGWSPTIIIDNLDNYEDFSGWFNLDETSQLDCELVRILKIYAKDVQSLEYIEGVELSHVGGFWDGITSAGGFVEVVNNGVELPFTTPLTTISLYAEVIHYIPKTYNIHLNKAMGIIELLLEDYPENDYEGNFAPGVILGGSGEAGTILAIFIKVTNDNEQPPTLIGNYGVILRDVNKKFGENEVGEPLLGFGIYSDVLPNNINDIDPAKWSLNTGLTPLPYDTGNDNNDFQSMAIEITAYSDSDPDGEPSELKILYTDIITQNGTPLDNRTQIDNTLPPNIGFSLELVEYNKL